jgi:hypothetical protein
MSRSYKKIAVIKDGGRGMKACHARKMRSKTRQLLNKYKNIWMTEDEPMFPIGPEVTNPYEICDWKRWWPLGRKEWKYLGVIYITVKGKKYLRK